MKCQKCDKEATFNVAILTGPEPKELHFCDEHAQEYLNQPAVQGITVETLASVLAHGAARKMSIGKAAEELQELDQQTCPICGISFHDLRHQRHLGCPHDYDFFNKQIDALALNFHGEHKHTGKVPARRHGNTQERMLLIKFRRDLEDAVQYEDYERASKLRDKIREIEKKPSG